MTQLEWTAYAALIRLSSPLRCSTMRHGEDMKTHRSTNRQPRRALALGLYSFLLLACAGLTDTPPAPTISAEPAASATPVLGLAILRHRG